MTDHDIQWLPGWPIDGGLDLFSGFPCDPGAGHVLVDQGPNIMAFLTEAIREPVP